MRMVMALSALVFVLGLVSAVVHARKGRWLKAGQVFLPVLGVDLMLFGGLEWQITSLFWLGGLLVVAGFGTEALTFWRARTAQREPPSP